MNEYAQTGDLDATIKNVRKSDKKLINRIKDKLNPKNFLRLKKHDTNTK